MWRLLGSSSLPVLGLVTSALGPLKPRPLPATYPTGCTPIPATPIDDLEKVLKNLDNKKKEWAQSPCQTRAELLRRAVDTCATVAVEAAEMGIQAKGSYGSRTGEELLSWMPIVSGLREFAEAMEAGGQPKPNSITKRADGQLVADVVPYGIEGVLLGGFKGELWIEPGKEATQGAVYKAKAAGKEGTGGVSLVLGAGNQVAVAALDILHQLIIEDCVVVCKMNPVNEYYGPYIRRALAPLVERGFVEIVYGGAKEGAFLCQHPLVGNIHLTGSAQTFDAIVWGGKKKVGEPPLKKRMAAELGCVTPYIITPGNWTEADINYNTNEIVAGLALNSGHNCLKLEVIITDADWPQRERYLEVLRAKLAKQPRRAAYYPGSEKKFASFQWKFPGVEKLGVLPEGAPADTPPFLLKTGLAPAEACTDVENWVAVLQEVALPGCGGDPAKFLPAAVTYANEKCWGTLSCSIFIPAHVEKAYPEAADAAVAGLRYGSVCVNISSVLGFGITRLTWGAFPGHTLQDIVSGNCAVHNTMLFDHPQKSVLRAPWRYAPTQFWTPACKNVQGIAPAAIAFYAHPGLLTLPGLASAALFG